MKKMKLRNVLIIARLDEFMSSLFSGLQEINLFDKVRLLHPSDRVSYSRTFMADTIFIDLKTIDSETEYSDLIRLLSSIHQVKTLIVIMNTFDPDICRKLREYGADGYIHRGMTVNEALHKVEEMVVHRQQLLYLTE